MNPNVHLNIGINHFLIIFLNYTTTLKICKYLPIYQNKVLKSRQRTEERRTIQLCTSIRKLYLHLVVTILIVT